MIFLPVDCELFKVKNYTLHPQKVHHINTTPFCQEPFCINMMPVLGFSCCIESVLVRSMLSENASEPLFWTLLLHVWDLGGSWAAISRFGKEKAGASTAILCPGLPSIFHRDTLSRWAWTKPLHSSWGHAPGSHYLKLGSGRWDEVLLPSWVHWATHVL